ncbi:hypothetical protein M413DRAFT_28064 [Hebeloma cylindrosporum]|uniref:Uncharacterized protein n=1 Tax=Hebeloma cylindrosporum TaxID=76867 RepID=A0A0C2YIQ5_HEBCY|nr:hypothetical protein M413DRAFT_28064 [Hebeloma cylindrosporum h7]
MATYLTPTEPTPLNGFDDDGDTRLLGQSHINQGGLSEALAAKLLSGSIGESQAYPDSQLVERFWFNVQHGHPGLQTNNELGSVIQRLRTLPATASQEHSPSILFEVIDRAQVDFSSVFTFCIAAPRAPRDSVYVLRLARWKPLPDSDDWHWAVEILSEDANELPDSEEGKELHRVGTVKEMDLQLLVLGVNRDGIDCPLTDAPFNPTNPYNMTPTPSYVVSNLPDTSNFIAMLAGTKIGDLVVEHLHGIGNIMNLECNATAAYDDFKWAIQAMEAGDGKVTYTFRKFVGKKDSPSPGLINLRDGDEIRFGQGKGLKVVKGSPGPLPALCNLQLDEVAEDLGCRDDPMTPTDFANVLTAKFLSKSGGPA